MAVFSRSLLKQIEAGALNSRTDLTDVLRKCIALGGRTGSAELRDWAGRELDGYRGKEADLPLYRWVAAPLLIDGIQGNFRFERRQISTMELPDFARDSFTKGMAMTLGVAELERMSKKLASTELQPAGMDDLPFFMNPPTGFNLSRVPT